MGRTSPALWSTLAIHNIIAGIYAMLGQIDEARAHAAEATTIAARAGDLQFLVMAAFGLGWCDVLLGSGRAAVDRLAPLFERHSALIASGDGLATLAEAYLLIGDLAQAEATVERFRGTGQLTPSPLISLQRVRGILRTRQGRTAEATDAFEEALATARAVPFPYGEATTLYEYGRMLAGEGKHEEARACWHQAEEIFRRIDARLMLARTEQALQP